MITSSQKYFSQSALFALVASFSIVTLLSAIFFTAEPSISYGQATSNDFYIRQQITDESSFKTVSSVTLTGPIAGVTGGTASGTTEFVAVTNNSAGYTITVDFEDNGTGEAMVGETSGTAEIRDFGDTAGAPSYGFTASTAAQFGYTVTSDNPTDTVTAFRDNASVCGGAGSWNGACWKAPSTVAYTIVDASDAATTGATSTIRFRVTVPSNPVPVPEAQYYTATATLSLIPK